MAYGSFKTIPNPLRQLPDKNLMISEAPLKSICFKGLNYYAERKVMLYVAGLLLEKGHFFN